MSLPPFPPLPIVYKCKGEPYKSNTLIQHVMDERDAWMARCRLAVESMRETADAIGGYINRSDLSGPLDDIRRTLDAIGPLPPK